MKRIGVYPGSFDPVTHGHTDIVRRALHIVDKLYVGVAQSAEKAPLFSLEQRQDLVRAALAATPGCERVVVVGFDGLLIDFAHRKGARYVFRGLRAASDFIYEFQLNGMNRKLDATIDTFYLMAAAEYQPVASSLVKSIAQHGGDISAFVCPEVARALQEKFAKNGAIPAAGGRLAASGDRLAESN